MKVDAEFETHSLDKQVMQELAASCLLQWVTHYFRDDELLWIPLHFHLHEVPIPKIFAFLIILRHHLRLFKHLLQIDLLYRVTDLDPQMLLYGYPVLPSIWNIWVWLDVGEPFINQHILKLLSHEHG